MKRFICVPCQRAGITLFSWDFNSAKKRRKLKCKLKELLVSYEAPESLRSELSSKSMGESVTEVSRLEEGMMKLEKQIAETAEISENPDAGE
jgi:hypothetical protein